MQTYLRNDQSRVVGGDLCSGFMDPMTRCGWCGHDAVMVPLKHDPIVQRREQTPDGEAQVVWRVYQCPGCGGPSLAQGIVLTGYPEQGFAIGGWYPEKPLVKTYPASVPTQIASVAAEAHGCLSVAKLRAAVALARAVVEAAAKAKGIVDGTIKTKIDKLFEEGFIYDHVKDAAHEVRLAGNEVAHGDLVEESIDADEAEAIVELMDMVLDGVFIAPGKSAAQAARREARKAGASVAGSAP